MECTEEQKVRMRAYYYAHKNPCPDCGKLKSNHSTYCHHCSKIRDRNPNWKGDDVLKVCGNLRARRWFPKVEGKEIHHIDGNPLNNDPSNIFYAERRQHMELDGRLDALIHRNKEGGIKNR